MRICNIGIYPAAAHAMLCVRAQGLQKCRTELQGSISDLDRSTDTRLNQAKEGLEVITTEVEELKDTTTGLKELLGTIGGENENGLYQIYVDSVVYPEANITLVQQIKNVQSDFADATELIERELEEHESKLEEFEPKVKLVPKILEVASDNRKILKSLGVEEGDGNNLLKQIQTAKGAKKSMCAPNPRPPKKRVRIHTFENARVHCSNGTGQLGGLAGEGRRKENYRGDRNEIRRNCRASSAGNLNSHRRRGSFASMQTQLHPPLPLS